MRSPRPAGPGAGPVIRCRLDSAFYNHAVVTAILTGKAQVPITAPIDKAVQKAISCIPETAWVSSTRRRSSTSSSSGGSDAEVAEIDYTAFKSKGRQHRVTARLVVRRVKRPNPKSAPAGQDELFSVSASRRRSLMAERLSAEMVIGGWPFGC